MVATTERMPLNVLGLQEFMPIRLLSCVQETVHLLSAEENSAANA